MYAIIARVKYKSKFSLVLIIIYSVLFVLWLPGNALILLLYIGSNF